MPFDTSDLLRQAGFGDGQEISLLSFDGNSVRDFTTTSTSFTGDDGQLKADIVVADMFPTDEIVIMLSGAMSNPTVEGSVRVRDKPNSTTLAGPATFSTFTNGTLIDWTTFTPTDPADSTRLRVEVKSSDGSAITLRHPTVHVGVRLG